MLTDATTTEETAETVEEQPQAESEEAAPVATEETAEPEATPAETTPTRSGPKAKKLFLGNISQEVSEEILRKHCEQYGEVEEIIIMKNGQAYNAPGNHRGFGFLRFVTPEATAAFEAETHELNGKTLNIRDAIPKTVQLFVGGIAKDRSTKETLNAYWSEKGIVTDLYVNVERGFCFVTLEDDGSNIKEILTSNFHQIDNKRCEIRLAHPTDNRRGRGGFRGGRGFRGRGWGSYDPYASGRGWGYGRGFRGRGYNPYQGWGGYQGRGYGRGMGGYNYGAGYGADAWA